jgi:D-lyxose ketol-isomerase
MENNLKISRRGLLGVTAAGLATLILGETAEAQNLRRRVRSAQSPLHFNNTVFYGKDGQFNEDKAKDVIVELCQYHGYPVFPDFKKRLWISDYGLGHFTEVGLACIGIVNKLDGEFSFMMQDLFLLPNQMLPEHWHEKPEDTKTHGAQKDEGWFIRWGRSYVIGEGEANLPPEVIVPESHGEVTVNHCTVADPGVYVPLTKRGSRHWQFAGKEGVILTEVANYHDNPAVRHTNKTANDHFLKGI